MSDSGGAPVTRQRSERFTPAAHVRSPSDFTRCFSTGKRAGGRSFTAIFRRHDGVDLAAAVTRPRLGLAISKKVDKRAVERNRLRRLSREWFRKNQACFAAGDLVIIGKLPARGAPATAVFEELDELAKRLGLMQTHGAGKMPGSSELSPLGDGS